MSTVLACVWPASYPDDVYTIGLLYRAPYALPVYIWLYCIVWWFIQAACKVAVLRAMKASNFLGINETGMVQQYAPGDKVGDEKMRLLEAVL
eukprot:gene21901-26526_t